MLQCISCRLFFYEQPISYTSVDFEAGVLYRVLKLFAKPLRISEK